MPWEWSAPQQTTFNRVSALNQLRLSNFALRRGRLEVVRADDELLAIARITPSETCLILLSRNPGNRPVDIELPAHWNRPALETLLISEGMRLEASPGRIRLQPAVHGYAFLKVGQN